MPAINELWKFLCAFGKCPYRRNVVSDSRCYHNANAPEESSLDSCPLLHGVREEMCVLHRELYRQAVRPVYSGFGGPEVGWQCSVCWGRADMPAQIVHQPDCLLGGDDAN